MASMENNLSCFCVDWHAVVISGKGGRSDSHQPARRNPNLENQKSKSRCRIKRGLKKGKKKEEGLNRFVLLRNSNPFVGVVGGSNSGS